MSLSTEFFGWKYSIVVKSASIDENMPAENINTTYLTANAETLLNIDGSSFGYNCYTIDFNINLLHDLTQTGTIRIYNLPIEVCRSVNKTSTGLTFNEHGMKNEGQYMWIELSIEYRGKQLVRNMQVQSCYTNGYPTRITTFVVSDALLKKSSIKTAPEFSLVNTASLTYTDINQLHQQNGGLQTKRMTYEITQELCKEQGYTYIPEHNAIIADVLYNYMPMGSNLIEQLQQLYSNCAFMTENNELFIHSKSPVSEVSAEEANLDVYQRQQWVMIKENYKSYLNVKNMIVIDESIDAFLDIPYIVTDQQLAIRIPLNVGLEINTPIRLVAKTKGTKIYGAQTAWVLNGYSINGKFSQVTPCSGQSELYLAFNPSALDSYSFE